MDEDAVTTNEKSPGQLLLELEEKYANRFSSTDEQYKRHCEKEEAKPPIVENWYIRPKRSFDWTQHRAPRDEHSRQRPHENNRRYYDRQPGPSRTFYAGMKSDSRKRRLE